MGTFLKADMHKVASRRGKMGKMSCEHENQDQGIEREPTTTIYFLMSVEHTLPHVFSEETSHANTLTSDS